MSTATGTLKFANTMSLKAYAEANGASSFSFVRNPNNNNLFGTFDNGTSCALAKKLDRTKPMVISECTDEDGVIILMVHNPSSANVEETLTFD